MSAIPTDARVLPMGDTTECPQCGEWATYTRPNGAIGCYHCGETPPAVVRITRDGSTYAAWDATDPHAMPLVESTDPLAVLEYVTSGGPVTLSAAYDVDD